MATKQFYQRQAIRQGKKYGISPAILMGLMEQESGFNPAAVSSAGARGITQFIPSTAKAYGVKYGTSRKAVRSQIRGAAHYLSDLGGKRNIKTALGRYYGSTASPYASEVIAKSKKYQGAGGGLSAVSPTRAGGGIRTTTRRKLVSPAVSMEAERQQAALQFIQTEDKTAQDYIAFAQEQEELADIPAQYQKQTTRTKMGKGGQVAGQVAKGKVNIVDIGKLAQQMGLSVGEHPKFGGVAPVHASGSYHYSNRAVDVSGDTAKMRRFARTVAKLYGPKLAELFWNGPGARNIDNGKKVGKGFVSGHTDHVHVAI